MAEVLRGTIGVEGDLEPVILFQRLFPGASAHKGETVSDDQDPRRQHLRRQRLGRGHRGLGDRPDRPVLVRYALPLALGADRQRGAADRAVDRRSAVLRDPVLPHPGRRAPSTRTRSSRSFARAPSPTASTSEITVLNHDEKPFDLTLRLEAASDFADLFEVKDALEKKGKYASKVERGRLVLGYGREDVRGRRPRSAPAAPRSSTATGLTFRARIPPQGEWSDGGGGDGLAARRQQRASHSARSGTSPSGLDRWLRDAPRLECDWEPLKNTYMRSLVDLAALRFSPLSAGRRSLPAAGLPWFMTMFGRDSIFTSLQALPFAPELAATTLRELGSRQGTRIDDFRDEDPGRILHEMRYGELTAFEERPHSPYYGSADATPLFVVLLDEYERWTGDRKLVRDFEYEALAALEWIDEYADLQGNGYISYQRRNEETGLENQCWKDSWDSISYRDGRLPRLPARDLRAAGLRLRRQDARRTSRARDLEGPGARRRAREGGGRSQAPLQPRLLDRRPRLLRRSPSLRTARRSTPSRRTTAICSGAGSWTSPRPSPWCKHLMGPELFSGWGVRTMAVGETRYNPIGYHVGTIWPFDNSFIAWGLRRYGFKEEAARIAAGILDAAEFFDGRLPEAFGGYPRSATKYPVAVSDGVQPAGVVDRHAAPAAADDARPRAARRPSRRRSRASRRGSAISSCWTSRDAGAASTPSAAVASRRGTTARCVRSWDEGAGKVARVALGHGHEVAGIVYGTVVAMATLTAAYANVKDPWGSPRSSGRRSSCSGSRTSIRTGWVRASCAAAGSTAPSSSPSRVASSRSCSPRAGPSAPLLLGALGVLRLEHFRLARARDRARDPRSGGSPLCAAREAQRSSARLPSPARISLWACSSSLLKIAVSALTGGERPGCRRGMSWARKSATTSASMREDRKRGLEARRSARLGRQPARRRVVCSLTFCSFERRLEVGVGHECGRCSSSLTCRACDVALCGDRRDCSVMFDRKDASERDDQDRAGDRRPERGAEIRHRVLDSTDLRGSDRPEPRRL